ncbi:Os03g0100010 [Oryza sativa Japonica Group]|uniref:Os03g0100010 protein n=1 Tax=Oryza sativa subsp. japonica TaxID=39947 RepID=A0A0P0VRQ9_ORYSJ|nr:hypothetical protein EE612_014709 [Oryza sativa]BAS81800.1 Os03g0100010 [Oryza sativa Japonica Group]
MAPPPPRNTSPPTSASNNSSSSSSKAKKKAVTPAQVAFLVERYLADNGFSASLAAFRTDAAHLFTKAAPVPPKGLLPLSDILHDYVALKEARLAVDSAMHAMHNLVSAYYPHHPPPPAPAPSSPTQFFAASSPPGLLCTPPARRFPSLLVLVLLLGMLRQSYATRRHPPQLLSTTPAHQRPTPCPHQLRRQPQRLSRSLPRRGRRRLQSLLQSPRKPASRQLSARIQKVKLWPLNCRLITQNDIQPWLSSLCKAHLLQKAYSILSNLKSILLHAHLNKTIPSLLIKQKGHHPPWLLMLIPNRRLLLLNAQWFLPRLLSSVLSKVLHIMLLREVTMSAPP